MEAAELHRAVVQDPPVVAPDQFLDEGLPDGQRQMLAQAADPVHAEGREGLGCGRGVPEALGQELVGTIEALRVAVILVLEDPQAPAPGKAKALELELLEDRAAEKLALLEPDGFLDRAQT